MLEPDPKEPTLEEVLRTEASHRHQTPVPLGRPANGASDDAEPRGSPAQETSGADAPVTAQAAGAAPLPPLATPAPAPVPRFVELSLEDAGGEKYVKHNEWNDYVIEAVDGNVKLTINGNVCCDRKNDDRLARRGIFGLQLHSGGAQEVRFKELKLEVLPK